MIKNLEGAPESPQEPVVYRDELSDKDKFDLAYRHINLLGQVIRNFPARLPGDEKLIILETTYLLGLRLLRELLGMLQSMAEQYRDRIHAILVEQQKDKNIDDKELRDLADGFLLMLSRLCALSIIKRVSLSIGVADLAEAYKAVLGSLGTSNATELIDLSIKLDHFADFPIEEVRSLHRKFSNNGFADRVLADLVTTYMTMFDLDHRTRQTVTALFKIRSNIPALVDPKRKKVSR